MASCIPDYDRTLGTDERTTLADCSSSMLLWQVPGQTVIGTFEKPVKPTGHIAVLSGNLAPGFAVGKITGKEGTMFRGPAVTCTSARTPAAHVWPEHRGTTPTLLPRRRCRARPR